VPSNPQPCLRAAKTKTRKHKPSASRPLPARADHFFATAEEKNRKKQQQQKKKKKTSSREAARRQRAT
jgi:hypothetical protein